MGLLLAVMCAASAAFADDGIVILGVATHSDSLIVQFGIEEEFFEKVADTLERGFSATIKYTVELWEPRRTWFDRLAHTEVTAYKIRYDSWSEEYIAVGAGGEVDAQASPRNLSICRVGVNQIPAAYVPNLRPDKSYYIHLNIQIQPLTVEEVRELEGWLRGTWGGSQPGESRTRGISRGLFGLVKNLTGFGDEVVSTRSEKFRLDELR
jgi:hypothetical protein